MKYHVEISAVREVTLLGRADLAYWQAALQRQGLLPANVEGHAQLLIMTAAARFKCFRFRETSISVFVSKQEDGLTQDGVYLIQAFNSLRFFAFVERTFFHTPYYHGRIEMSSMTPALFQVTRGSALLRAAMASSSGRELMRQGEEGWEGPIYLPRKSDADAGKLFFGKIGGVTEVYPFLSADEFRVQPADDVPALQALLDSHFEPLQWHLRQDGRHGKSKTVGRDGVQG